MAEATKYYKIYFWNKSDGFDCDKAECIQVNTTNSEVSEFIEKMKVLPNMVYSFENYKVVFYRTELLKISYSKESDGKRESRQNKLLFKVRNVVNKKICFIGLECDAYNYYKKN